MRILARKAANIIVSLAFFAGITGVSEYLIHLEKTSFESIERNHLFSHAATVASRLNQEVNATLNLILGLTIYVAENPNITQGQFDKIAARIISKAPYIRNMGLAKDNVITHLHPFSNNEKAMGLRYLENEQQRDAVIRAIDARNTVIAGPVDLLQGGRAFISRVPVFLDDGAYWGIASSVIHVDTFLEKTGVNDPHEHVKVGLRGKDATGEKGEIFYGDPAIFESPLAVLHSVPLPVGSWQIAVIFDDAASRAINVAVLRTRGVLVAALFSVMLFALLHSLSALTRANEQAKFADENKNRFFTNMAHELRTPMAAIAGAIGLIKHFTAQKQYDEIDALMNNAERNCERLKWIINDILDLKKLESGRMEYDMQRHRFRGIVAEAVEGMAHYADQHQVVIKMDVAECSDCVVVCDKQRIQQVLFNLLSNAVKFSQKNTAVRVTMASSDNGVRLEVRDTGPGIPAEKIDEVFSEFAHTTRAKDAIIAGTGLGLAISKRIVVDHQGRIGCRNSGEGGCTFYFELTAA